MTSSSKVQWTSQVVASKSKYTPLRPQFVRHGTSEVASTARDKLDDQASRPQHDLRLLVGHANTLDYLMERLYARQQNEASNQHTTKAAPQERSQDGPPTLHKIEEESNVVVATEQTLVSSNTGHRAGSTGIPEEASDKSYFDLREDKVSPALSIVELLDSDSDISTSEEDGSDVDSESDVDGNYSNTKS